MGGLKGSSKLLKEVIVSSGQQKVTEGRPCAWMKADQDACDPAPHPCVTQTWPMALGFLHSTQQPLGIHGAWKT